MPYIDQLTRLEASVADYTPEEFCEQLRELGEDAWRAVVPEPEYSPGYDDTEVTLEEVDDECWSFSVSGPYSVGEDADGTHQFRDASEILGSDSWEGPTPQEAVRSLLLDVDAAIERARRREEEAAIEAMEGP